MNIFRNIQCRITQRRLGDYVDGLVSGPARARLQRHLETCDPCRAHSQALQRVARAFAGLPREQPAADFVARVMAAVRHAQRVPRRAAVALQRIYAAGAVAATVLIVALSLLLRPLPPRPGTALSPAGEWQQLAVELRQAEASGTVIAVSEQSGIQAARDYDQNGYVAAAAEQYANAVFGAAEETR